MYTLYVIHCTISIDISYCVNKSERFLYSKVKRKAENCEFPNAVLDRQIAYENQKYLKYSKFRPEVFIYNGVLSINSDCKLLNLSQF